MGITTMHQAFIEIREFAQEFEQYIRDMGIANEDTKVYIL